MDIKLINIGFGNIVAANRIISIISPARYCIPGVMRYQAQTTMTVTILPSSVSLA